MYRTGWKLLAVIMIMALLNSQWPLVMTGNVETNRSECITKTIDYLNDAQIDDSIKVMVIESRKSYPDVRNLLKAKIPRDYIESISKRGYPEGCDKLIAYYENIDAKVPCYKELGNDDEFNEHVMEAGQKARDVFEACFLCHLTNNVSALPY